MRRQERALSAPTPMNSSRFTIWRCLSLLAMGLSAGFAQSYTFTTLAGQPGVAGTDDGTGAAARFNRPARLAVDSAGNIYVLDSLLRKITPEGVVSTLAGGA